MSTCPRCDENIQPLRIIGVDVTSRLGFSLAIAVSLLAVNLLATLLGSSFMRHFGPTLLRLGAATGGQFLLSYFLLWPFFMHLQHRPRSWVDLIVVVLLFPSITFLYIWLALWRGSVFYAFPH